MTEAELLPGVVELDHTADVGMRVRASSLEELLRRAAGGMFRLMWGEGDEAQEAGVGAAERAAKADRVGAGDRPIQAAPAIEAPEAAAGPAETRAVHLEATAVDGLLVRWLRELLYLHEVHGFVGRAVRFDSLTEARLSAQVSGGPAARPPIRELKGVTYHGLAVEREADGWQATVIFDV